MNLFFVIFPGICGLIGVIFTAIGVGITRNRRRKEQLCTMYTTGTVVDVVRRVSHSSGSSSVSWHPVFSYYAGGQQIVKESHFGNSKPQFTVGQTVQVYYDPYDPECYYVAEESIGKLLGRIFTWVGIACLAVAAGVLAVGLIILR